MHELHGKWKSSNDYFLFLYEMLKRTYEIVF